MKRADGAWNGVVGPGPGREEKQKAVVKAIQPRADGEREETNRPGAVALEAGGAGVHERRDAADDDRGAVAAEADRHEGAADGAFERDEGEPARAGGDGGADVDAA